MRDDGQPSDDKIFHLGVIQRLNNRFNAAHFHFHRD